MRLLDPKWLANPDTTVSITGSPLVCDITVHSPYNVGFLNLEAVNRDLANYNREIREKYWRAGEE